MRKFLSFVLWALLCCCWTTQAEIFTSISQMTDLIYMEKELVQSLGEYIKAEESKLSAIKSWANKLDALTRLSTSDPEGYLAHPVNAYKLMKRLNTEWSELETLVLQNPSEGEGGKGREGGRKEGRKKWSWTRVWQLLRSAAAPAGVCPYNRNDGPRVCTVILTPRSTPETHTETKNTPHHTTSDISTGLSVPTGNRLTRNPLSVPHATPSDPRSGDAVVTYADPSHQRAGGNLRYFEGLLTKQLRELNQEDYPPPSEEPIQLGTYTRPKDHLPERDVYEALCRGEGLGMNNVRRSRLYCRYQDRNRNPRLLLKPIKEEDEWDSPRIVRYLDVLSHEETERIKQLAKPRLARATVRDPKTGVLTTANYRVSKSAWLEEEDDPVIARVNQRIEDLTGLEVDTAELLQVANYGVGGQYEPHYDFSRPPFDKNPDGNRLATFLNYKDEPDAFKRLGTGNRVATFLNYMSDVEAGGATVFPDFGAAIWPRKGTAVFWYNLFKSGEGDYRTRHAACPVLVGSKWVSNKWIHERGQEFRRPCGLTEVDRS
ncbi:prolyl 4-hydroxylase subunit alpha-2-like [Notothenia coriiceps]|uniref:procollagen-proline 4-dioxygenase n=1 Tax=Notothenia coriiceps TaxID=8208 RepID=A0A6I9MUM8_9TELE|nr:PREDICTED: prolyl 4-hydroxylase subunit alpha-2-like [Notothenia coriiceps]